MRSIINSLYFPSFPGRMSNHSHGGIIDTPSGCELWIGPRQTSQQTLNCHAMADHSGSIWYTWDITMQIFWGPTQATWTHAVWNVLSQQWFEVAFWCYVWLVPILSLRDVHVLQRVDLHSSTTSLLHKSLKFLSPSFLVAGRDIAKGYEKLQSKIKGRFKTTWLVRMYNLPAWKPVESCSGALYFPFVAFLSARWTMLEESLHCSETQSFETPPAVGTPLQGLENLAG
jgi:hypothetical protein